MIKNYLDDRYFNYGDSRFTDEQYDLLKEILVERDPSYIPPVGSFLKKGDKSVTLPYFLGSMDKFKPEHEKKLNNWLKKYKANEYILQHKLDGMTCLLVVDNDKINLYTRGDGTVGKDISHLQIYFNLPKNLPNKLIVRGELLVEKKVFADKYSSEYSNSRNFVTSIVGADTSREGLKDINFVTYEILNETYMCEKPSKQLEKLTKFGFKVVPNITQKSLDIPILKSTLTTFLKTSPYDIDGLITWPNNSYELDSSNNPPHFPPYAFAFKMPNLDEIKTVEVIDVEWSATKWNYLKPRVLFPPTLISGVMIKAASGFNAKFIRDNKIGPGTLLEVERSGGVIPDIGKIVKGTEASFPKNIKYRWNDSGVDILLDENNDNGEQNDEVAIKKITSFFDDLKIKQVKEQTVKKLYDNGFNTIIKILEAKQSDFEKIDGFQKKLAERTYNNIHEKLKDVEVSALLGALGVFGYGISEKTITKLFEEIPNFMDIKDHDELYKKIVNVKGFSDITTTKIIENLDKAKETLEKMKKYVVLKTKEVDDVESLGDKLKGMTIVTSGFRDKKLITDNGGKETSAVSKNTSVLVIESLDEETGKIKKAKELGVVIMLRDNFMKKYRL